MGLHVNRLEFYCAAWDGIVRDMDCCFRRVTYTALYERIAAKDCSL